MLDALYAVWDLDCDDPASEEYEYFWVNQLDVLLSSGMSDGLMSKTVEEDWMVLV